MENDSWSIHTNGSPPNSPFFHVYWSMCKETISLPYEIITLPDDVEEIVTINVAGELFQTYSKTLDRYPNTLLGSHERRKKYATRNGELFFDRQFDLFEYILYYYQSMGELYHPTEISVDRFLDEMKFFDLGNSVIQRFEIENGLRAPEIPYLLPNCQPNHDLWKFMEYPDSSRGAKICAVVTVLIIVLSMIMFVIETIPEFSTNSKNINCDFMHNRNRTLNTTVPVAKTNKHAYWIFVVNTIVIAWFTTEFVLRLVTCPTKIVFFSTAGNIIDLLSILPYYMTMIPSLKNSSILSVVRVVRVLRVLKLTRYSQSLQILGKTMVSARSELAILAFFLAVKVLLCGSIIYFAEYKTNGKVFRSIPHSFWWAIVSLTTTGYGDMVPITPFGKVVGTMTVCCSILILVLPVPSVVSHFTHFTEMEHRRKAAMKKKSVTF